MNGPEKKVFILAVLLLGLGVLVKLSPWDPLPRIETFSYEEESREVFREQNALTWHASKISDSTATESAEAPEKKKPKKAKKAKPAVHFPLAINRATVDELCANQRRWSETRRKNHRISRCARRLPRSRRFEKSVRNWQEKGGKYSLLCYF